MAGRSIRIGIVGLGQIGGSLMLALRRSGESLQLGGYDLNRKRLASAQPHLHFAAESETELFRWAEIVFLATPVQTILQLLHIAGNRYPSVLFTDVGSTKRAVVDCAHSYTSLRFVPGHPFAGNEREGEQGWDSELFSGRPYFLVSTEKTSKEDLNQIRHLVAAIGAHPVVLDAATHDRLLALTSHLPLLLSAATALLFESLGPGNYPETIGSGIRSVARLAGGSPTMGRDLLFTNRDEVLPLLRRLKDVLDRFARELEQGNGQALLALLERAQKLYWKRIADSGGSV
jgi:prephenate dehydrogenase